MKSMASPARLALRKLIYVGPAEYWLELHCIVERSGGRRCSKIFGGVGHSDKFVLATNELWGPDYCPLRWRVRLRNECEEWGKVDGCYSSTHTHTRNMFSGPYCWLTACFVAVVVICWHLRHLSMWFAAACGMWAHFEWVMTTWKQEIHNCPARMWAHSSMSMLRHVRN